MKALALALFVAAWPAWSAASPAADVVSLGRVEPGLRERLAAAGGGAYVVRVAETANLAPAASIADWDARGRFVYDALRVTAAKSQASLIALLEAEVAAGRVAGFRSYWIVNAVEVTSGLATLDALAALPGVERIESVPTASLPPPAAGEAAATEWGVARIGAPGVWADFGKSGEGIVVANVDSGVDHDHPALVARYRGTLTGSHDFSFYDPTGTCGAAPCDNNDHGTHTMGTMVGDDGGANRIGVAPGATWIAAKGCETSTCSASALTAASQWILAPCPGGIAPGHASCDPARRPHVVNNSWGGGGGSSWFQAIANAWRAAGIVPVFSAGNEGPAPGSTGSPGDYCNVLSIAATDVNDAIASFSSRGPGGFAACPAKPDLAAPGVSVRSSIDGGGYASFQGTSMAAPHVAGCVALLKSIDPSLEYDDVRELLVATAVDLGAAGSDYASGAGRIDCRAAAGLLVPDFTLAVDPARARVCSGEAAQYTVEVGQVRDFADPVSLTARGVPPGFVAQLSANPVTPPGTSSLTLQPDGAAASGAHDFHVDAESTTGSQTIAMGLDVYAAPPAAPSPLAPADGATDVPVRVAFAWSGEGASAFRLDVARDAQFASLVHSEVLDGTVREVDLAPLTRYHWRVAAINPCGAGPPGPVRSFETGSFLEVCRTPSLLVPDNAPGVADTLDLAVDERIADVDVSLHVTHTWVGDLVVDLEHVDDGTRVTLVDRPGRTLGGFGCEHDDVEATIDDEAPSGSVETSCSGTPPAISGTLVGGDPPDAMLLSTFDGERALGSWRLKLRDLAAGDVGTLVRWCLLAELEATPPPTLVVPGPLGIECGGHGGVAASHPLLQAWLGDATADGDCPPVVLSHDAGPLFPPGTTPVTFTATDACGKTTEAVSSVTVEDTIAPTLECPPDLVLDCPANVAPAVTGTAIVSDTCDATVLAVSVDETIESCGSSETISRAWSVTDTAGNPASCVQEIAIVDGAPPSLSVPAALTLECDGLTEVPATDPRVAAWLESAAASDGCGSVGLQHDGPATYPRGTTSVTFVATDACGNVTEAEAALTVACCGDGAREGDEACDDGNFEDGDGCSASCEIESGLAVAPGSAQPGGTVTATWTGIVPATARDWIGLYTPGAAPNAYAAWLYAGSCAKSPSGARSPSGACPVAIPATLAPGAYELRLYADNGFGLLATSGPLDLVAAAGPSVAATPAQVAPGQPTAIGWSGVAAPSATDWIGIYVPGAAHTAYRAWFYTSCNGTPGSARAAGSCAFPVPSSWTAGTYELRLFANNGYTVLATSTLGVVAGGGGPTIGATPSTIGPGQALAVQWSGIASPRARDWIGLYSQGAANAAWLAWSYVSCTTAPGTPRAAGECALTVPATAAPGTYEVRLLADNGYAVLATSGPIAVAAAAGPTLRATPDTADPGDTISVEWSGVSSPAARDWIGLYAAGAPNGAWIDWKYTSCTRTPGAAASAGSCAWTLPATLAAGAYELRLFRNNTYTRLAWTSIGVRSHISTSE